MGTDNLFHKRKARQASSLERRKAKRAPYAKVLIVCEGTKTEPHYFQGLKDEYQLNGANIEITGDCDSSPDSICQFAFRRYTEEKNAGDPFDRVYCVFDKDSHETYGLACGKIARATPKDTFLAVTSVPCFEYWLLLHFHYSTAPYESLPGNSVGDQSLADLKKYMPHYQKGDKGIFTELAGQLEHAKSNAKRANIAARQHHTDNPSTQIHELVEFLQALKDVE